MGSVQWVIDLAQAHVGSQWLAAVRVAWCESGFDIYATGSQGEMGLWQINPRYHPDATYDPAGNAAAMARISGGGYQWGPWMGGYGIAVANGANCPGKPGFSQTYGVN